MRGHCLRPEQPWALAHAILVFGKDLEVGSDLAVERLVVDHLPKGKLRFPARRDNWPVEPHPGMFLKTLIEVGVPFGYTFKNGVTLSGLLDAYCGAYSGPSGPAPFHNQAWLLEAIAASPKERRRAEELSRSATAELAANQEYFEVFARDPNKTYRKPFVTATTKSGVKKRLPARIHRYFCGGFHFFQAVQRLHGKALPASLKRQYELLWVRLDRETKYWDTVLAKLTKKYRAFPENLGPHRLRILAQKLKLQGHALETVLRAVKAGALTLDAAGKEELARGFELLGQTVEAIEAAGIYGRLDALRDSRMMGERQLYLDYVGDSAHALHAYVLRAGASGGGEGGRPPR